MKFEEIAIKYEDNFGEEPPTLPTLDVENEVYLEFLQQAIEDNQPITKNELGDKFMTNDEAMY